MNATLILSSSTWENTGRSEPTSLPLPADLFHRNDPLGFEAGDANLYRYVTNNPSDWVDPTGTVEKLAAIEVTNKTKAKVGTLQVEYGSFDKDGVGIKAVFTSKLGKPATLKAAAQAYDAKKGDHLNWYQVVVSDTSPLYFIRDKKLIRLKAPYVDPPPGGYNNKKGEPISPPFDDLPWFYNEGKYPGPRAHISFFSKGAEVSYRDFPAEIVANTTIKYKTWLVVVDKEGKFVAWAGVGFQWTWSNATGKRVVSAVKKITGSPDKKILPDKIFPPK
jgi:hypothetical protein